MSEDRWSLRNIYLYLVCLITLIMVIVAVVGLVRSSVELLYPDPGGYYPEAVKAEAEGMTEEQIEEQRERDQAAARRYAILNLVGNVAMLLVAGPLYVYHWRKIEHENVLPKKAATSGV